MLRHGRALGRRGRSGHDHDDNDDDDNDDDDVVEPAVGGDDEEESRTRTAAIAESFKAPMLTAAIASVQLQVHPDLEMSDAAIAAMAELCHGFFQKVVSALPNIKWGRLSAEAFVEVVHSSLKQSLGKHCLSAMKTAMTKDDDDSAGADNDNCSLHFSVKLWAVPCLALVGNFAPKAAVALAAALEYLTAEVLELGGSVTKDASLSKMDIDQMEKAIVGDEELNALFRRQIRQLNANSVSPEILDIRVTDRLKSRERYFRRQGDTVVAAGEDSTSLQDATDACCDGWIAFAQQLMDDGSAEQDGLRKDVVAFLESPPVSNLPIAFVKRAPTVNYNSCSMKDESFCTDERTLRGTAATQSVVYASSQVVDPENKLWISLTVDGETKFVPLKDSGGEVCLEPFEDNDSGALDWSLLSAARDLLTPWPENGLQRALSGDASVAVPKEHGRASLSRLTSLGELFSLSLARNCMKFVCCKHHHSALKLLTSLVFATR